MAKKQTEEIKTTQQPKKENEFPKPKWFNSVLTLVKKIVLETTQDKQFLKRIRFETSSGNITYKPSKIKKLGEMLADFELEFKEKELYSVSEFVANNPLLVLLSKESKKEMQEVILSYCEIERFNEEDETTEKYKYLTPGMFNLIYYNKFDKDKIKLDKMNEYKNKYSTTETEL